MIDLNEIRLSQEAATRLAEEVAGTGRDVQEFVNLAVLRELGRERYENEEIRKGLADAESGNFASTEEVDAVFSKYDLDETH